MTMYVIRGDSVFPEENADNFSKTLPANVYNVAFNGLVGFYLEKSPVIKDTSGKIYGEIDERAERSIYTYHDRLQKNMNTGVLLLGKKGSGKTKLARVISQKLLEDNIPTIIVSSVVHSENVSAFCKFMNLIDSKVMVLFDEFEKNFSEDVQEKMLSLFDGVSINTKLFVLTANDPWSISSFMINRPGRMYYKFDYTNLDDLTIKEYINDALINNERKEETIEKISNNFKECFSFDMLQSVIEEMNRFDINLQDAIKYLNVDVESESYDYTVYFDDTVVIKATTDNLNSFGAYDNVNSKYVYFSGKDGAFSKKHKCFVIKGTDEFSEYTCHVRPKTGEYSRSKFFGAF